MKKRIGVAASVFSVLFLQAGMRWAACTNEGGALPKRWISTFEAATHKRGALRHVLAISLLTLILMAFCSARADAALGDLLYTFGEGGLNKPSGVAVHTNGDVYVTDMANNRVTVFDVSSGLTGTLINTWGSRGNGNGQFYYPSDIALDSSGNVYVTGAAYLQVTRVQEFTSTGTFIRSWGGPQGSGDGQFKGPNGVAINSNENEMYVVDSLNNNVQVFSTITGSFLRKWGTRGSGNEQLNTPGGIAADSNGDVYVIDSGNSRVQVFSSVTGSSLRRWGVNCSAGLGDPHVCEGDFSNPQGIAVDAGGNVYVADSHNRRVQVFSATGSVLGVWGLVYEPFGITVDGNGKVYVTDPNFYSRINVYEGACQLFADAGPDQTVEQTLAGTPVTLDGSSTFHVGDCGENLTYSWSWPGGELVSGITPTVLLSAGTTTVTLLVTNGTQTSTDTVTILVHDTMSPVTTAVLTGTLGTNDWYTSDVVTSLTATDSGSGVKEIHYTLDGTQTIVSGAAASFSILGEGTHSGSYFAIDNAGLLELPHPLPIKIDKTAPTIIPKQFPLPNATGWNNTDVDVTFECSDGAGSGIVSCPTSTTVTASETITGEAMDAAGLISRASITVKIDKTPPVITITCLSSHVATPSYTVTDGPTGSGVASENATLSCVDTNGVEVCTYTVYAADLAGNTTTLTGVFNAVH